MVTLELEEEDDDDPSSLSTTSPFFRFRWDVFLSFRGEDTRHNFTDRLYRKLIDNGIRTFRDDKGLERGEEIHPSLLTAIKDSAASIAVISKNYATSRWCLEELAKILDCRRLLLPVFYKVDPSHVRHQNGPFEKAFRSHEQRLGPDSDKVVRWKKAMEKVGGISGWDSRTQEEPELIQSLVKRILTKLSITPLGVAKYPSLSHDQLLISICDFSPDWAYSGIETKVLISVTFLGESKHLSSTKWCCMFSEVEVPAEVVTGNVLRCQAPVHVVGRVPFYVTGSNRLACSEVREFRYHEKPSEQTLPTVDPEDETRLQIRFAKMLFPGGLDRKLLDCSIKNCDKCNLKSGILSFANDDEQEWVEIEKASISFEHNFEDPRNALIQKLLKDKLYEWLVIKVHEGGKGPNILDDEGQGVIHLASSLGYGWALGPIVAAGISPNFRDAHGRTGLHWAAYFGRKETVVALVRLGAAPGTVEDQSSKFPRGRTAADLASIRGHEGIARYLAEVDLTSHLPSLTPKESVMDIVAAEKTIEPVKRPSVSTKSKHRGCRFL